MKLNHYLLAVAAAGLLLGCDQKDQTVPSAGEKPVTGKEVKEQYKDALNTTKDYVGQSKDEFLAAANTKLKDLDGKIDELAKKSEGYKEDAKVQADKALAALREQRSAAGKKYDEMKDASKDVWDKAKAGFASAWEELEKSYEDVKSKFQ
ncbi:MAG: hypothetical protein JWR69_2079 [Pedosphaera sp.]|nr:hypothetical protein [Pedosphaera sp.]